MEIWLHVKLVLAIAYFIDSDCGYMFRLVLAIP